MIGRHLIALVVTLLAAPALAGETDVNAEQRAEREVAELHEFFEQWYRAALPPEDFRRFEQALAPGFVIINPSATVVERDSILDAVRDARGSDPNAHIHIENFTVRRQDGNLLIATYEEWQQLDDEPERARLSTVVLRADDSAPNGWVWLHVHETWMEPAARR